MLGLLLTRPTTNDPIPDVIMAQRSAAHPGAASAHGPANSGTSCWNVVNLDDFLVVLLFFTADHATRTSYEHSSLQLADSRMLLTSAFVSDYFCLFFLFKKKLNWLIKVRPKLHCCNPHQLVVESMTEDHHQEVGYGSVVVWLASV